MLSLGKLGRFGNQLFQYAFLRICALQSGAQVERQAGLVNRCLDILIRQLHSICLPQLNSLISSAPPIAIPSDKVAAVVPLNSLTEDASLTALRSDIQKLLEKLAQSNPTPQQAEQSVEQAIQQYPTLKRRLQKAMDVGGREALKAVFAHPFIQIPASMLEAWVEEK